jgi:hypothetical protein
VKMQHFTFGSISSLLVVLGSIKTPKRRADRHYDRFSQTTSPGGIYEFQTTFPHVLVPANGYSSPAGE